MVDISSFSHVWQLICPFPKIPVPLSWFFIEIHYSKRSPIHNVLLFNFLLLHTCKPGGNDWTEELQIKHIFLQHTLSILFLNVNSRLIRISKSSSDLLLSVFKLSKSFFFNWDSLHARLNSYCMHEVTRKRSTKRLKRTEKRSIQIKVVC